ncbi:SDR family oxidoreductase [Hymenobacter terrenus]|uniref:SDR family oxidoreductase n=1 Tax=Hymenobacter terrenus TaxID=1629124 RepID=UPI000619CB5C|nr:NmrA family NAD(P)-binding protein [Hymenobacter terrenus]
MKTVFVTGANGLQGAAIAAELGHQGFTVRALEQPQEQGSYSPRADRFESVVGSLDDVDSLINGFRGADHVALTFPLIFDTNRIQQFAHNIVAAHLAAPVQSIVFNTSIPVPDRAVGAVAIDSKRMTEAIFDQHELPYISLRPTIYLDNLAAPWSLPLVTNEHILPYPVAVDARVAWLSHHDLGVFVAEAIKRPQLVGQKFNLGGLQRLTGDEVAAIIGGVVGHPVQFVAVPPDAFEQQLAESFGAEAAREIANIYRFVANYPDFLQAHDLRDQTLVHLPVSLQLAEQWAARVAWRP